MAQERWTISIDAGGTFTDAIARSSRGGVIAAKVASTPDDPSRGLANAVTALVGEGLPIEDVSLLCHGTTVATNATLTGSPAISMPCGRASGLPVGLQLVGRRGADAALLNTAAWVEAVLNDGLGVSDG